MPNIFNVFAGLMYFVLGIVISVIVYYSIDGLLNVVTDSLMRMVLIVGAILVGAVFLIYMPIAVTISDDSGKIG